MTKELKESNDKNTELLMKYNTLKAEFQVKENQNKELEKKIKQLKHVHVDINKSNQELNQNISSVKKIVKNSFIYFSFFIIVYLTTSIAIIHRIILRSMRKTRI